MDLAVGTERVFRAFAECRWWEWAIVSLVGNAVLFAGSVGLCACIGRTWSHRRVGVERQRVTCRDLGLAVGAVVLNAGVGVAGWLLWKEGWIHLSHTGWERALGDTMLLLGIMDLGMYLAHRVAHHRWIFRWVHAIHHTHESVNPISLFVLHPGEVVGFGALLIVVLMSASWSGAAVLAYLGINFLFGTLGHSGVEPFPACWARIPVLREIGSSTFHANHHRFPTRNFGFYTAIWDRIFRTGGK